MRHFLKGTPSQAAAGKRPLVIVLHGAGASAAQVLGMAFPPSPLSVWLDIAEREQLLVIAPDGCQRRGERCWNDGNAGISANPRADDVGLVGALIDLAIAEDDVDPARVYVIGVSKGGMLAYRLASEIGARLAAFSAVLAAMPVATTYDAPAVALPALIVAGTADLLIPYARRRQFYRYKIFSSLIAPLLTVEETVAVWRGLAGLSGAPQVSMVAQHKPGAPTRVSCYTWGDDARCQVTLVRIDGGGHAEPSISQRYPGMMRWFPGAQNGDVEVAELAWQFFSKQRLVPRAQDDLIQETRNPLCMISNSSVTA